MSDIFPDIEISKIDRINLLRQEEGRRGPGSLAHAGLPAYVDVDELVGLCEETGPGRYKAIALDARGKPLGPAWSWEVTAPFEPPSPAPSPEESRRVPDMDDELRALRAAHREELEELRLELQERAEDTLLRELEQAERRAESKIELAQMDAEKRIRDAEHQIEDARRRARDDVETAREEVVRYQMRVERLEAEVESRTRTILEAKERVSEVERTLLEQRMRLSERITELESELKNQVRVHEAELRELRNGSPEVHAMIARNTTDWEIEKSKLLLQADLDERARQNGFTAKITEMLQQESVQEALFPILNHIVETIAAQQRAKPAQVQVAQPLQQKSK